MPEKMCLAENELALSRFIPYIYSHFFLNNKLRESNKASNKVVITLAQMVHTLHVMIAVLMSPREAGSKEVDSHVKLFLGCCHRFSLTYWPGDKVSFWANTGNFPTLLNLAEQIQRHGSVRWYWEGTSKQYIQQAEKVLVAMKKTQSTLPESYRYCTE